MPKKKEPKSNDLQTAQFKKPKTITEELELHKLAIAHNMHQIEIIHKFLKIPKS